MADNVSPERVRLGFKPSPLLADALMQFYRPEYQQHAHHDTLRSIASFAIRRYGGRLVGEDPTRDPDTVERRMSEFEANHLRYVDGHQIPMASYLGFRQSARRDLRIDMRLTPNFNDRNHLFELEDFPLNPRSGTIDVYAEIFPGRRELGRTAMHAAAENLSSILQINRTTHKSEYARTHSALPDSRVFAEVEPRLKHRPELTLVPSPPELWPLQYEDY